MQPKTPVHSEATPPEDSPPKVPYSVRQELLAQWAEKTKSKPRLEPESLASFLRETCQLVQDISAEISVKTARGILSPIVLSRLTPIIESDWIHTSKSFSELSFLDHVLPMLRIFSCFPDIPGKEAFEIQRDLYTSLFQTKLRLREFLKRVLFSLMHLQEYQPEKFYDAIIISMQVFKHIIHIMFRKNKDDTCNVREMAVRLVLLITRMDTINPVDRERLRRDARALVEHFGLSDDIRIHAKGPLKYYFSIDFHHMRCPAGDAINCAFPDGWCCFRHDDEDFEHARDRATADGWKDYLAKRKQDVTDAITLQEKNEER
ncbi:hypothetical protein ABW19_dt0209306 [Dactylella cylindrospora]|nr:hypothetical protein ABW19_dt0209306 [Dactylella cylindrospora]